MCDVTRLAVFILAVVRVTGLVTVDELTRRPREWVLSRLDDRPASLGEYVSSLITCAWCASVWVAAAAAVVAWFHHDNPVLMMCALVLAASQVAGMLARVGR